MRKNIEQVLRAFASHKPKKLSGVSCWTDGDSVYSYWMKIATRQDGSVVIIDTCFSRTTNSQIKACREFFPAAKLVDSF